MNYSMTTREILRAEPQGFPDSSSYISRPESYYRHSHFLKVILSLKILFYENLSVLFLNYLFSTDGLLQSFNNIKLNCGCQTDSISESTKHITKSL